MKVFKYDISRASRTELVTEISVPDSFDSFVYGSDGKVPKHNPSTTAWYVVRKVKDRRGNPIEFSFPVCFCTGQSFEGDQSPIWEWYVLLPSNV